MYKIILMDLDDTLLDYDISTKYAFYKLLKQYKIKNHKNLYEEFKYFEIKYWELFEKDELNIPIEDPTQKVEYSWIELMRRFFNISYDDAIEYYYYFENLLDKKVVKTEDYIEVLGAIRKHCELFISTNGSRKQALNKIKALNINYLITGMFSSSDCGYSKSSLKYYEWILEKLGYPDKKEILVVGDSIKSDIMSGNNAGLDTCWYNRKCNDNNTSCIPTYQIKSHKELLHKIR